MKNDIYPCLWFNGQAKAAAEFYGSVFENAAIIIDTPMVVNFTIEGKKIMGLNGGPMFTINPSISLFVTYQTNEEIEKIWAQLIDGGKVIMALDKYSWSEKYGWLTDKFGMTWQLMLGKIPEGAPKITPSLLFAGQQYGKAQQAIKHYTSIFENSAIHHLDFYKEGEEQPTGNLKFGHFSLGTELFAAMDGVGDHTFNEAVSFVVNCDTQEEIDYYWNRLTEGGQESRCGWLKDKFGISWQIIPSVMGELMSNRAKASGIMAEVLQMKKIDLQTLLNV